MELVRCGRHPFVDLGPTLVFRRRLFSANHSPEVHHLVCHECYCSPVGAEPYSINKKVQASLAASGGIRAMFVGNFKFIYVCAQQTNLGFRDIKFFIFGIEKV